MEDCASATNRRLGNRQSRFSPLWNRGHEISVRHAICRIRDRGADHRHQFDQLSGSIEDAALRPSRRAARHPLPDAFDVNPEFEREAPNAAPLVQALVFEFSGRPNPTLIDAATIQVRDSGGASVPGTFDVRAWTVTFTPQFPLRAPSVGEDGTLLDSGGAGFAPAREYTIRIDPARWPGFLTGIDDELLTRFPRRAKAGVLELSFATTDDPAVAFRSFQQDPPRLVSTSPADGSTGVSPQLYDDPEGLFAPRSAFELTFDGPVAPWRWNLDFALFDLDETSIQGGLELGTDVSLVRNDLNGAVVAVQACGILPLGHLLALESPQDLRPLYDRKPGEPGRMVAATFQTAFVDRFTVRDTLITEFADLEDAAHQDQSDTLDRERLKRAEWNTETGLLEAAPWAESNGVLGRLLPVEPADGDAPRVVTLDTDLQTFPLLDGSTPDAPMLTVQGGVFAFTDIEIPKNVIVQVQGNHPLVLLASGSVKIAGTVQLRGRGGASDYRSHPGSIAPVPGGSGGPGAGRGGDGHTTLYFPPDQASETNFVSAPTGAAGFLAGNAAAEGGRGGASGILDHRDSNGAWQTDQEIDCTRLTSNHNNGSHAAGGGGGSMLRGGRRGKDGKGNVTPNGAGLHVLHTPDDGAGFDRLAGGRSGEDVFLTSDPEDDYVGPVGELGTLIGGQGGGGGGSFLASYYCGRWCREDSDTKNDAVCGDATGGFFPDSYADARGGGGGGGGGGIRIHALGSITLKGRALIDATGGDGGAGADVGCANRAGGAGGGSGGAVLLQSTRSIDVRAGAQVRVDGGRGADAAVGDRYMDCDRHPDNHGSGGNGGIGLIQLQLPAGLVAEVDPDAQLTPNAWVDPDNVQNPIPSPTLSAAQSRWLDLGRAAFRREDRPLAYRFRGTDRHGFVEVNAGGDVLDPGGTDFFAHYPGRPDPLGRLEYEPGHEPREHHVPPGTSIEILFQGADPVVPGSKEVDPNTITRWSPHASIAEDMQFLRWRVVFHLAEPILRQAADRPALRAISPRVEF